MDEKILHSLLVGILYLLIVLVKWLIGLVILVFYDWWRALGHCIWRRITCSRGRYKWKCKPWFIVNE